MLRLRPLLLWLLWLLQTTLVVGIAIDVIGSWSRSLRLLRPVRLLLRGVRLLHRLALLHLLLHRC